MAIFNVNGDYSILYTEKGVFYIQDGRRFDPNTFADLDVVVQQDEAPVENVIPDDASPNSEFV